MSEYRRLISYMYEYEGDEKGKNIGFVKLETRNGQCRLNVNIKRMYVGGNAIGVYLLSKQGDALFLGNMFVRGGSGEFRTTVDAKNVEGSGNRLDEYFGLTVHDVNHSWRSYRTIWEDAVVPAAEANAEDMENTEAEEADTDVTPCTVCDPEPEPMAQEISPSSTELEDPALLRYLQETEEIAVDPEQLWTELRKTYPKIQPFDYDGGSEVLTICPQDIGKLPRENWVYGNNSFLLHGYYNFRYLILIRLENANGNPRYLLGVPGHYYSNEKYMANMFGFPNFVLSKKQPPNDGRFGYWYTDIKMK